MEKNEIMTISNGNLIEFFAPGLIYDVRDLFNGNLLQKDKFPYGQGRLPMQLTTTVRNFDGLNNSIQEIVNQPERTSLNQAVANFYARHTTQAERTSMQNMRYYSCAITNRSEFALKVGVGAHYTVFSAQADLEIKNARDYKTLYFEATKELFTISARPASEAGFFESASESTSNLGYISSVTYGVRIIAKVEVENTSESMQADLKASFEAGIAGVNVSLNNYKASSTAKTIVTLYAVGGRSDRIGTCTVDNIESTIRNFLLSANYQVAQPIKLQFSTLEGRVMSFMDATDNFTYEVCKPKVIADESITTITLDGTLITPKNAETDYDFYGKIWVEAFNAAGHPIRDNGNNHLMNVDGMQEIDLDSQAGFRPGAQVSFTYPPGQAKGGYLYIYYAFFDQDANTDWGTGDDDQFSFINQDPDHQCELGPTSRRLCYRVCPLSNLAGPQPQINDYLWNSDDGTGIDVLIFAKETVK
ncbi:MAG: thiol-activated cytolysin family protein [Saprospiraceae bacterium]